MNNTAEQVWNTCGYVRLSREDGDKEESNSVTGQKDLIRDYLSRCPELRECGMKVDDGYTGSNFDRPGFMEMMDLVEQGRVGTILVKDHSRLGRNRLSVGALMERFTEDYGVRYIAVADGIDSDHGLDDMVAVRELFNEFYPGTRPRKSGRYSPARATAASGFAPTSPTATQAINTAGKLTRKPPPWCGRFLSGVSLAWGRPKLQSG